MLGPRAAEGLLRLYPRAWRERYGEELLAMVGRDELSFRQVFDLVRGAIDAWSSAEVRSATRAWSMATDGGSRSMLKSMLACDRMSSRVTKRDSLIGAGVMIGATAIFSVVGMVLRRAGLPDAGEIVLSFAFSASLTLSMPFWLMKGQPWKAQTAIVGTTLIFLVAIAWLASLI